MKHFFLYFFLVLSVGAFAQENLLENGSFENSTSPELFELVLNGATATTNYQSTNAYDGNYACEIDISAVGADSSSIQLIFPKDLAYVQGKVYELSFYMKSSVDASFTIVSFDSLETQEVVLNSAEVNMLASDSWQKQVLTTTAETDSIGFKLMLGKQIGLFTIDSISISVAETSFSMPYKLGSYYTDYYRNLFTEVGKDSAEVSGVLEQAFETYFHGNPDNERLYFQITEDMAYILDYYNQDVRSEGMSYGMMVCVQLNKKFEFDCLWNYAKTYMQHKDGARKGYFGWALDPKTHTLKDNNSASDGEEYIAMALFFAANRWGNGEGIYNYEEEAQQLLYDMIHLEERNGGVVNGLTNIFDLDEKKVVFVPQYNNADYSDPSYHLPAFYELWALWADQDNDFWKACADTSRQYFQRTMHPNTGLTTEYMTFEGEPKVTSFNSKSHYFSGDAYRTAMNVAMDASWWGIEDWQTQKIDSLLNFFQNQGSNYKSQYEHDGTPLSETWSSAGLYTMNAVAPLAATTPYAPNFVNKLYTTSIPKGTYRYYDGLLYYLAYLNASGNYKIWKPGDTLISEKPTMPTVINTFNPYAVSIESTIQKTLKENVQVSYSVTEQSVIITNKSDRVISAVTIVDTFGRNVQSYICNIELNTIEKLQLPSSLNKGVYIVNIHSEAGSVAFRIMK